MINQFKAGDLVLITAPENAGRTGTLVDCYFGPCRIACARNRFQDVPPGVVAWTVKADGLVGTMTSTGAPVLISEMAFGERWLMPLRGDFALEQQKTKETEPCA